MNSPDIFLLLIISFGFAISTVICHNLTQLWKDVAPEEQKQKAEVTSKSSKAYKSQ
jgi:hypothetical protein